jgi:hypothetical protein
VEVEGNNFLTKSGQGHGAGHVSCCHHDDDTNHIPAQGQIFKQQSSSDERSLYHREPPHEFLDDVHPLLSARSSLTPNKPCGASVIDGTGVDAPHEHSPCVERPYNQA